MERGLWRSSPLTPVELRQRANEVEKLGPPPFLDGKLIVDPEHPSVRPPVRLAMEGIEPVRHGPDVLAIVRQPGVDESVFFPAQRGRDLADRQLRMVLNAPKHAATMSDLDRLYRGDGIAREQRGTLGQTFDFVRMQGRRIPYGRSTLQKRVTDPSARPGYPPRNPPSSRSAILRILPPAAATATCKPAHEPKEGVPDSKTVRMNCNCRRTGGVSL